MKTYETITLTIPLEDGYSFSALRQYLSEFAEQEIAPTTLHGWIRDICLLRDSGVYSAIYTPEECKFLITWIAFRRFHKRGVAAKKFREYLENQLEDES